MKIKTLKEIGNLLLLLGLFFNLVAIWLTKYGIEQNILYEMNPLMSQVLQMGDGVTMTFLGTCFLLLLGLKLLCDYAFTKASEAYPKLKYAVLFQPVFVVSLLFIDFYHDLLIVTGYNSSFTPLMLWLFPI